MSGLPPLKKKKNFAIYSETKDALDRFYSKKKLTPVSAHSRDIFFKYSIGKRSACEVQISSRSEQQKDGEKRNIYGKRNIGKGEMEKFFGLRGVRLYLVEYSIGREGEKRNDSISREKKENRN